MLNQRAKQRQGCSQRNFRIKASGADELDSQDQAGQNEERQRHCAMESRDSVFQFAQTASLNLTPLAGVRTSGLARTGVAGRRGSAVEYLALRAALIPQKE